MRKSLWIILAVMVVAISAPNAHADSFTDGTINFTVTSGSPTPTGSFVFDNTTDTFTSFAVDWDGAVFACASLSCPSNLSANLTGGNWCAAGPLSSNGVCAGPSFELGFVLFFPGPGTTFTDPAAAANGTFTVTTTSVATPEPSSVALMLLGVGLLFVMRKRIGQRFPQAS
jgi:hypothetical protein